MRCSSRLHKDSSASLDTFPDLQVSTLVVL